MGLLKAVSASKSVELINVILYASYKEGVLVREDYVVCFLLYVYIWDLLFY